MRRISAEGRNVKDAVLGVEEEANKEGRREGRESLQEERVRLPRNCG